ncbi:MG2 domain-containing protein [Myxococcota bacterium]|nr:MG2 domain-containing protein [Myxococcota bacterium]
MQRARAGHLSRWTGRHAGWLLLALASACGSNGIEGPPEILVSGDGEVDEPALAARLSADGTLDVAIPVRKLRGDELRLRLAVDVVDFTRADEVVIASASRSATQTTASATHELRITGLPSPLSRADASSFVLVWRVEHATGLLRGRKSLYAALPGLEVQLKGATELPESGSVPLRVIARDPRTGGPIADAEVIGELSSDGAAPIEALRGRTDARGEHVAHVSAPAGVASGLLSVVVRTPETEARAETFVTVVGARRVMLSTDKTIYKPGQTLELRALALDGPEKRPIAAEEITFEATDAKGNKVFKRRTTTDEFGVASMRVPTDVEVNEGTWKLRASLEGAVAEQDVPVARYVLPKMSVAVSTDRDYVLQPSTITGRVDARYVFGRPVTGASVELRLESSTGALLDTDVLETDGEGHVDFSLDVPFHVSPYALEDGGVAVTISARVTDTAGQIESGATSLPLAASDLVLRALPEAGALVPGLENVVYVLVSDPVGRPIVATIEVEGAGPMRPVTTDADGVAELRFVPAATVGASSLSITARDGAGRSHHRDVPLFTSTSALLVRTDRARYTAPDTAIVTVLGPTSLARAYVDVFQGRAGRASVEVDLTAGRGEALVELAPELGGVLTVEAFALGAAGALVGGQTHAFVETDDHLSIALTTDRAEYAPGDEARVTVEVTDASGAPRVASIGLTVVDDAVFLLGGEPRDDLRTYFDLDPRAFPAELRVLGHGPSALYSDGGPADRERFARMLFAALGGRPEPRGLDYNSLRSELPRVQGAQQSRIDRDVRRFLATRLRDVQAAYRAGTLDDAAITTLLVEPARMLVDAFGRNYQVRHEGQYSIVFHSAGPNEVFDALDDVELWADFQWLTWADPATVDEDGNFNPWQGGVDAGAALFDSAVAADAGVGPPGPVDPGARDEVAGVKVRLDFRETVYANPQLVTDSSGRASVSFPLADSITTWRMTAQGSTLDGKLGAARATTKTFQDFFIDFDVPGPMTVGDVVELSAIVYNYLPSETEVEVTLEEAPWLTILSGASQTVRLAPSEVRAVKLGIRAERAGSNTLLLRGRAGAVSDAIARAVRVVPNGTVEDETVSDRLSGSRIHVITIPHDALEGGTRITLAVTPGFASEAVAGTEGLLTEPGGCFEQTTSSAWPNTMVTLYLEATGQLTPELGERAIGLVTRGYQRLLTFESPTGGFNWWGDGEPGNRILSAIMVWHLKDMEGVIETDPAVRDRTLAWLLGEQRFDGSWPSGDALHAGNETLGTDDVRTTAFITWALAHTGWAPDAVERASVWLRANVPDERDLYANALAANALVRTSPEHASTSTLLARLDTMKQDASEGRLKWVSDAPSWTGAGGDVGAIETTSLVAYGLMSAQRYPANVEGAVRFIVANKDAVGSWYNTQATMNALRALLAAASGRSDFEGTLDVSVDGRALAPIVVTSEDSDVHRVIDLTPYVGVGSSTVSLSVRGSGELAYRLTRRVYRPHEAAPPSTAPLSLEIAYASTRTPVNAPVRVDVAAAYTGEGVRDQVIVRVGRAPGFVPVTEDLEEIVRSGRASRFEVDERTVTFYLMGLEANVTRDLGFSFVPSMPLSAVAPGSEVYLYYEPTVRLETPPIALEVTAP